MTNKKQELNLTGGTRIKIIQENLDHQVKFQLNKV